jgi:hypothetical protein
MTTKPRFKSVNDPAENPNSPDTDPVDASATDPVDLDGLDDPADTADVTDIDGHRTPDDSDEYEFVRLPNGKVVPVRKDAIQEVPETSKSDAPPTAMVEKVVRHFYVHLANGDVERVAEEDLPIHSGTNAQFGFWQKNNKVYDVIGVYPVEHNL